jgi:RNA-splicing ligase RtcB
MFEITGKYNTAKVFTEEGIEEEAYSQIQTFTNHPAFIDSNIAIMPDVHAGKGVPIGFTCRTPMEGIKIVPAIVGVDIGCGILCVCLGKVPVSFEELDKFIRAKVPSGTNVRNQGISMKTLDVCLRMAGTLPESWFKEINHVCDVTGQLYEYVWKSVGTLGGGK